MFFKTLMGKKPQAKAYWFVFLPLEAKNRSFTSIQQVLSALVKNVIGKLNLVTWPYFNAND